MVCNTVDRARAVHTLLQKALAGRGGVDCDLLIGRARPLDRQAVQERVLTRFGTSREPSDRAAVLVATQTVEVGVNLDVDVLVSESASWDALVQRLGRLNRLGELPRPVPGPDGGRGGGRPRRPGRGPGLRRGPRHHLAASARAGYRADDQHTTGSTSRRGPAAELTGTTSRRGVHAAPE